MSQTPDPPFPPLEVPCPSCDGRWRARCTRCDGFGTVPNSVGTAVVAFVARRFHVKEREDGCDD